jgi:hypothetical protein
MPVTVIDTDCAEGERNLTRRALEADGAPRVNESVPVSIGALAGVVVRGEEPPPEHAANARRQASANNRRFGVRFATLIIKTSVSSKRGRDWLRER